MIDQAETEAQTDVAQEEGKIWQPSGKPEHRIDAPAAEQAIVVAEPQRGLVGRFLDYWKRPFVKLVIGLGIFILAAIVYDATINFGPWTERPAKPKAAEHHGAEPIPLTPDG